MIRVPDLPLPSAAHQKLMDFQQEIDKHADYAKRVEEAKKRFSAQNKKTNATFREVRKTLRAMCAGACRCMYCEDSCADEVEHFKPKDLYPEAVFRWENYLYACGPCNGPKNNGFAVFHPTTQEFVNVTRPDKAPVAPPFAGANALIDPRQEDPMAFLELDLLGTFEFAPLPDLDPISQRRAEYTIELLHLNDRDILIEARSEAFEAYSSRLYKYVGRREDGASAKELETLENALKRAQHPTVWQEMKRWQVQGFNARVLPDLHTLFVQAPHALTW